MQHVHRHGRLARGMSVPVEGWERPGKFGRLFPRLDPRPDVAPFPSDLGLPGGPMDAIDPPPPNQPFARDNGLIPAGWTFFGQFVDHDLTLDRTPLGMQQQDEDALRNFRTPFFDLDSVYGEGPNGSPELYEPGSGGRLRLREVPGATGASKFDVPRDADGLAQLGDGRNDENVIISQLHAAFLQFHNVVFDKFKDLPPERRFRQANRLVRWHYQWIVLHEFLPLTVGAETVDQILWKGRRFYFPEVNGPFMPIEYAGAVYRFGHSQVRPGYRINATTARPLFTGADDPGGASLNGGFPFTAAEMVDWPLFFVIGGSTPAPGKAIDSLLSTPLLDLPFPAVAEDTPPSQRSLAVRNLQRAIQLGLPSGQSVAARMGFLPLQQEEVWRVGVEGIPKTPEQQQRFDAINTLLRAFRGQPTPLWYYILREAELLETVTLAGGGTGNHLGPVGGTIVAETMIGLLQADKRSFLSAAPNWTPDLGPAPGVFGIADLLKKAGVA